MAQTILLIFITFINLTLWFIFFVRFKKTFSPEVMLHDVKNEVNKLLIEINRTVDQDIALIENRIQDLKALIQAADKRLKFLQKEQNGRTREKNILEKLSAHAASDTKTKEAVQKYTNMQVSSAGENGIQLAIDFNSYNIDEPEIVSANLNAEPPLKEQVVKLYADGLSVDDISKRLKLSITEVQFIVDLFLR